MTGTVATSSPVTAITEGEGDAMTDESEDMGVGVGVGLSAAQKKAVDMIGELMQRSQEDGVDRTGECEQIAVENGLPFDKSEHIEALKKIWAGMQPGVEAKVGREAVAKPKPVRRLIVSAGERGRPEQKQQPKAMVAEPKCGLRPWPDAPTAPDGVSKIEALTYPRGLLGHVVQYIYDTSALPHRLMALWGALTALAKGADRKVIGPTGAGTVLFNLLIAETGAGKQHELNCIRMILRAMEREDAIAAGGLSSMQGIEEILEGGRGDTIPPNPNPLVTIDEVGGWLARIGGKSQVGNVSEIPSTLQSLWGWPPGLEWVGSKSKGKDIKPVHGPAFAICGASTERKLFEALKLKEVSTGFINRMIALNAGRGAEKRVEPRYSWQEMPSWLARELKQVIGEPVPLEGLELLKVGKTVLRDFTRLGWGPGAKERWFEYDDSIRGMPSVEDREWWIRAPELAVRLATIVALYRERAVRQHAGAVDVAEREVDLIDLEWGIALAELSTRTLKDGMDKFGLEDLTREDLADKLREAFRRRGTMSVGECHQVCKHKAGGDFKRVDEAIWHLDKVGDIEVVDQPMGGGAGRPTTKYRWRRDAALADPGIRARLAELGGVMLPGSPGDLGRLVADETKKWAEVIKFAGIKAD
jgi:hypothetical protein